MNASADRLYLDHLVLREMAHGALSVRAYATPSALEGRRAELGPRDRSTPRCYRLELHVPTFISPTEMRSTTEIAVDVGVEGYPYVAPLVWCTRRPAPFSPHFHPQTGRYCIGPWWQMRMGVVLLGEMVINAMRQLNWDETLATDYAGWNPRAARAQRARGYPLTPGLKYPRLPHHVLSGVDPARRP